MPTPVAGETAWWCPSLDDAGNNTTTLNDLVGDHHVTLSGFEIAAAWADDADSGGVRALEFFSTRQGRVEHDGGDVGDYSTRFQVSAWFKTSNAGTGANRLSIIGQGGANTSGQPGFRLAVDAGRIWIAFGDNDSRPSANIGSGYADGAWHHVLADIIPSGTTTVYVDGSSVGTMSTANESDGTTALGSSGGAQPLGIGRYVGDAESAGQVFVGRLDDLRIGTGLQAFVAELASQRGYQPDGGGVTGSPWYYELNQQLACYRQEGY